MSYFAPAISSPLEFYSLTRQALADVLAQEFAQPQFRADQLFRWVYREKLTDFSAMTDISKELRSGLAGRFAFSRAEIAQREISRDGTRKYLLEMEGGDLVEAVMIKQPKRTTLCLSSQVGCAMACAFCRTGTMGLKRNLSASEIIRQVLAVIDDARNFGDMFQNIVFMGMGEPLHNYKPLIAALEILKDPHGLNISGRKITVSSVGLVPAIERFGKSGVEVNLAISLNATTDQVRREIMPITKAYPISDLLQCLRNFPLRKRKRITIEYVMLSGVNDSKEDLQRLPLLLKGLPVKINLIPYNNNAELGFRAPSKELLLVWQDRLLRSGIETTIRWSKGGDIKAACGQLATVSTKRGSAASNSLAPSMVS